VGSAPARHSIDPETAEPPYCPAEDQVVAEGWSRSWQRRSRIGQHDTIEHLTQSPRLNLHSIDAQAGSRRPDLWFRVNASRTSSLMAATRI
jgi:hypothetical protein